MSPCFIYLLGNLADFINFSVENEEIKRNTTLFTNFTRNIIRGTSKPSLSLNMTPEWIVLC